MDEDRELLWVARQKIAHHALDIAGSLERLPKLRAERAFRQTEGVVVSLPAAIHACEAAIIADRRELLAPDEATVEARENVLLAARGLYEVERLHEEAAICGGKLLELGRCLAAYDNALAALRRLKGVG